MALAPFKEGTNYVSPSSTGGFTSVVGGASASFGSQAEAEADYNKRATTSDQTTAVGGDYSQSVQSAIENAATRAYYDKRLQLIDVPMLQLEKDRLAQQAAQFAATQASQDKRLQELEKPQLQINRDALMHQIAQDASDFALKAEVSRGDLALRAAGQASQEGIQRAQLAQTGFKTAEDMALAREKLGQDAANNYANQGIETGKLLASLRGPRNAFVQQNVAHGMNANGQTRALAAITNGWGSGFTAPHAAPEAATLETMAQDMAGAGGVDRALSPQDLAYVSAMKNTLNPVSRNAQAVSTQAYRDSNQSYASPSAQAALQIARTEAARSTPDTGVGQRLIDAYEAAIKRENVPYLSFNDPRLLAIYQSVGKLNPTQAMQATTKASDYYRDVKSPMGASQLEELVSGMQTQSKEPPLGKWDMAGGTGGGFNVPTASGEKDWMGRPKGGMLHESTLAEAA